MGREYSGDEPWHGKRTGYSKYRCKCEACLAVNMEYRATYRLRTHGAPKPKRQPLSPDKVEHRKLRIKQWREENKERVAATNKEWVKKNREAVNRNAQLRRAASRDDYNAKARAARMARPEAFAAASIKYREANREVIRRRVAKWREENREHHLAVSRIKAAKRRAKLRDSLIVPFTKEQLMARMAYWGDRCYMCGSPWQAIDHVKPISRGGAHCLSNLRPACAKHNSGKKDRWHGPAWIKSITGTLRPDSMVPGPDLFGAAAA